MRCILYKNAAENNRIDKSNYLTELSSYDDVKWLEETGIYTPTILIADDYSDINADYCYIPEWSKYYFINEKVRVRVNLWRLTLKVDPLYTYKTGILGCYAIFARSTSKSSDDNAGSYDHYIYDPMRKTYVNPKIDYFPFPNGFPNTGDSVILTVAGGHGRLV